LSALLAGTSSPPGRRAQGRLWRPGRRGIAPDLLIGTSAGALNAAYLASRPATAATAEELATIWRGLRRSDILPLRPATLLSGLAGRRDHLIPDRALRRLAARHLQFDRAPEHAADSEIEQE
jgi:NTE family protein